jgi:hypothetical protein
LFKGIDRFDSEVDRFFMERVPNVALLEAFEQGIFRNGIKASKTGPFTWGYITVTTLTP